MRASDRIHVGTAGWSISAGKADAFPAEGSGLERYSAILSAAEINSSFHRPHRASTWERWRESAPDNFRFSVKLRKSVTHEARLIGAQEEVQSFFSEASLLREKLAVVLVQMPPSLVLDLTVAGSFFADLAKRTWAMIAVEPRHASWFTTRAEDLLREHGVARVGADPARFAGAAEPLAVSGLAYWRLHGSPVVYRSSYSDRIGVLADEIAKHPAPDRWCIFDNTASSAATGDALELTDALACRTDGSGATR